MAQHYRCVPAPLLLQISGTCLSENLQTGLLPIRGVISSRDGCDNGTKRPFTYGGNSFWALGRTPQPRRIRSVSAGPRHKLYSEEREEYYSVNSILSSRTSGEMDTRMESSV